MTDLLWFCPVPLPYYVTQTFSQHPGYGKGTDFGGDNMPIRAMRSGRVSQMVNKYYYPGNPGTGYANWIVLDHGKHPDDGKVVVSYYAHLRSNILVKVGDLVNTGQLMAYSDNTGMSTGPHLHAETRKGNVPFDWFKFVRYTVEEVVGMPPVYEVPEFPVLPVYTINVGLLNIRQRPGTQARIVGQLQGGAQVDAISGTWLGGDYWLQIGRDQYIAAYYQGQEYATWLR